MTDMHADPTKSVLRCALISSDELLRRHVMSALREDGGDADLVFDMEACAGTLPREVVSDVHDADPRIVFVDFGPESTSGLRVIEALAAESPDRLIIAAGPELGAEVLLQVIRGGASEYLPRPIQDDEVLAALRRARRKLTPTVETEVASPGRVFAFFSPKGGVGVTTAATNLAVAIGRDAGKSTLLLDLSDQLGTAPLLLGLQPRYSYLDLVQNFHRLDRELFESFLAEHDSGISLLGAPSALANGDGLSPDHVRSLLGVVKRRFEYVIVDVGRPLSGVTRAAVAEADERLLVVTPEVPTLRNASRMLSLVGDGSGGVSPGSFKVLLNEYREGTGVSEEEVKEALGLDVFALLEHDEDEVTDSANLGHPVVFSGRSRYSKDIRGLAADLLGPEWQDGRDAGPLTRLVRAVTGPFRGRTSAGAP